jgi:uncharacterized membrane protein YgcG
MDTAILINALPIGFAWIPVLLGISIAMSAAAGAVGVMGAKAQAKASTQMAKNQAAALNAEAARRRMETAEKARRMRIAQRFQVSRMEAQFGKAGVDLTGSPLAALAEGIKRSEMEIDDVMRGASAESADLRMRAAFAVSQGRIDSAGYRAQAAGTLLSTGASLAGTAAMAAGSSGGGGGGGSSGGPGSTWTSSGGNFSLQTPGGGTAF